jgi:hypothetical protein
MEKRPLYMNPVQELPAYVGSGNLDPNGNINVVEEPGALLTLKIGTDKFVGLTTIEVAEALQHLEILRHVGGFVYCGKPGKPQRTTTRKASAFPNSVGYRKGSPMVYGATQPRPSYTCPICRARLMQYLKTEPFYLFAGQVQAYIREAKS